MMHRETPGGIIDELWVIALKKLAEEIVEDYRVTGTCKRTVEFDINHLHSGVHRLHVTFEVFS